MRLVLAVLLLCGALLSPARAATTTMLSADEQAALAKLILKSPPGWLWAGPTDLTTTSRCYRDPRTPFCAIDRWYVCFARHDRDICDKGMVEALESGDIPYQLPYYRYRLLSMRMIHSPSDLVVAHDYQPFDKWQNGDVIFGVEVGENPCSLAEKIAFCFHYHGKGPTEYLLLHFDGKKWILSDIVRMRIY